MNNETLLKRFREDWSSDKSILAPEEFEILDRWLAAALESEPAPLAVTSAFVQVDKQGWGHLEIVESFKLGKVPVSPIVTVIITERRT
jgi:hypothetical protein